jgi:3-oxoacyl-[acyl-carrier protein] reductase
LNYSRNIRCNAIAPGFIETEMTAKLNDDVVQGWRDGIPLKRGGTTEDSSLFSSHQI